jgi:hypothetical protein
MAAGENNFGNAGYPAVPCTAAAALQAMLDMNMISLAQQDILLCHSYHMLLSIGQLHIQLNLNMKNKKKMQPHE